MPPYSELNLRKFDLFLVWKLLKPATLGLYQPFFPLYSETNPSPSILEQFRASVPGKCSLVDRRRSTSSSHFLKSPTFASTFQQINNSVKQFNLQQARPNSFNSHHYRAVHPKFHRALALSFHHYLQSSKARMLAINFQL